MKRPLQVKLWDEGTTILLSAHQKGVVEKLCTRIFVIHQGDKVLCGTAQDIQYFKLEVYK